MLGILVTQASGHLNISSSHPFSGSFFKLKLQTFTALEFDRISKFQSLRAKFPKSKA